MLAHLPAETVCCWTVSKVCCTTGLWATLACPFVGLSGSRVEAQGSAQAHTSICWKISAKSGMKVLCGNPLGNKRVYTV